MQKALTAIRYFFLYLVLFIGVILVLYPIVFTISSAFSQNEGLATLSPYPFTNGFSLEQFQKLFSKTDFGIWYQNTLKIALINTSISVVVITLAAYIFSRMKFPGRKGFLMSMLIFQMFPSFAGMIALFIIVWRIGLLDTHFGLILIYAAGNIPYNTWLIKSYMDTIPKSMDEAARVDGASHFRTF